MNPKITPSVTPDLTPAAPQVPDLPLKSARAIKRPASLTLVQAAEISGFSTSTLRVYARKGVFPAYQPRGRRGGWAIDEEGFGQWMVNLRKTRGNSAMRALMRAAAAGVLMALLSPALVSCSGLRDTERTYSATYDADDRTGSVSITLRPAPAGAGSGQAAPPPVYAMDDATIDRIVRLVEAAAQRNAPPVAAIPAITEETPRD